MTYQLSSLFASDKRNDTMSKKLKPVDNLSLVDRVEQKLKNFVEENDLKPGDPLPKEIDLAQSLGVSRTVVREAILRLRTVGLIKSKKHSGMVLTEPDILSSFGHVLNPKLLASSTLKDIFELRMVIEIGIADLLFERINPESLRHIQTIVENGENGEDRELEKTHFSLNHEIEFHGALYQITQNKTILRFQSMLLPVFEWVHENHYEGNYEYEEGFISHRYLFQILSSGTPDEFRKAMRSHLAPHFARVFSNTTYNDSSDN